MADPTVAPVRVAYLTSRFPKLSETFVVDELLAVRREGIEVHLFPMIQESERLVQPDAGALVEEAHFAPFVSADILRSAARWLREDPRLVAATVAGAVRGVARSRKHARGLAGTLLKTLHLARTMRSMEIDHVHAHFAHHPTTAALLIHRLTGIPFSFTGHGHDVQVDRTMLCEKLRAASFAIAISEHNRELMTEGCPDLRSKVDVLHVGVDPDHLSPDPPTSWARERWFDAGPRVLAVGRLEAVKGHAVLLQALARPELASAQCTIVGDGPERPRLAGLRTSLGLDARVQLPGPLTRDRVIDLMRSADVVVLPSVPTSDGRVEGIPVVLMEAMSVGAAVVASDLPGVRELVRDGVDGVLVPAGDPAALARAVAVLGDDPARRAQLGQAARSTVRESFNGPRTAAVLARRFRDSAARSGGRQAPAP